MNTTFRWHVTAVFASLLLLLTACEDSYQSSKKYHSVDPSKYFDFSTMSACPIEIDFDRQTLINVYDVDPDQNPDAKPIYATFTDLAGHYSGTMQIPSAYVGKQLWARGFGFSSTASVGSKGVVFASQFSDPRSRDGSADPDVSNMYTDEELVQECRRLYGLYLKRLPENQNNKGKLVETDNLAIHTLKDNTEIMFSFVNSGGRYVSQLYYFYFPEEVDATEYMKEHVRKQAEANGTEPDYSSLNLRTEFMRLFTNDAADPYKKFLLTRDWGVFYTGHNQYITGDNVHSSNEHYFVKDPDGNVLSGNGFTNAPLSFTDPQANDIQAANIIQQYNGSTYTWDKGWKYYGYGYVNRNFNNNVGAHHHLRFYGPNYDENLTTPCYKFPANYRIGFILKVRNTDNNSIHCFTTNNALNLNEAVQCARNLSVSPSDVEKEVTNIVYGYEDNLLENIGNSSTEPDYNDFMFLITATPAVSTVGLERVVEEGEMFIDGTLLYEDLYPLAGDYDMNDVMVEYEMWIKFDKNNLVTSIESRFWPINYGATYNDDFYMELTAKNTDGVDVTYIEPEMVFNSAHLRQMAAANMADVQAGRRPQQSVVHTHTFTAADKLHRDALTIDSFNPFIYVHNTNREVHLTNDPFCGVNGASIEGLTPDELKYYPLMISDGSILDGCYFPYAMNVPRRFSSVSMEGFTPVTEAVYIVLEYQRFLEWMRNPNDLQYKDWYNYYQKWPGQVP